MVAFVLVVVFMIVEVLAGWWTGSLALISDAGHMATDALGLGMSLAAIVVADKIRDDGRRTYGIYRRTNRNADGGTAGRVGAGNNVDDVLHAVLIADVDLVVSKSVFQVRTIESAHALEGCWSRRQPHTGAVRANQAKRAAENRFRAELAGSPHRRRPFRRTCSAQPAVRGRSSG
ncbi:MAG: cation transporter [Acidimicrobiia bacterium]